MFLFLWVTIWLSFSWMGGLLLILVCQDVSYRPFKDFQSKVRLGKPRKSTWGLVSCELP